MLFLSSPPSRPASSTATTTNAAAASPNVATTHGGRLVWTHSAGLRGIACTPSIRSGSSACYWSPNGLTTIGSGGRAGTATTRVGVWS